MQRSFALLDTPGGGALLFDGLVDTLPVTAARSLADVCGEVERRVAAGCFVVAALDYELGAVVEPSSGAAPDGLLGQFLVFSCRRQLDADALSSFLHDACGDPLPPATLASLQPMLAPAQHAAAVARIREYIAAGDCYQVNFTFPVTGSCVGDPLALYARLRAAQPVAHGGLIVTPDGYLLSFSPELFVARAGGVVTARPMKGTASRGDDAAADLLAAAQLQGSAKDRAENVMIVDLIRNDLGRIALPGSVTVTDLCTVEAYPSVFQMTSTVTARSDAPLAVVLGALFPCGSITGAPKIRAMQIIRELEPGLRGPYTGAFGWIGAGGDFSLSVAIRTLQIESDGRVRYGVGSGIVWDSEADSEYRECLLKAAFLTQADPGFRLIETLRLEDGRFPLREGHLDRLAASATCFAFVCERAGIAAQLMQLAATHPAGIFRVRLTLGHDGDVQLAATPLDVQCAALRTRLASERLQSTDVWLRHKTTVRARYDAELKRIVADPALFDSIFLNERDEVCEGARSNVFIRRRAGEALLTPPLSSGLLPGVLRGSLLASGEAAECVIYEADLHSAAELYLGNALRGLVRVSL